MNRSSHNSGRTAITACFCLALVAGVLPAQSNASRGPINVIDYGAAGDGATDDTAAVQAALNAAAAGNNQTYFPCGVFAISQPLEVSSPVRMDDCATIRALVAMPAVVRVGSSGLVSDGWFRGGIIDANNLANDGLFLRQFAHMNVTGTAVVNALVNGFHLGDPSIPGSSFEGILSGVRTRRTAGVAPSGSTGLLVDTNATDNNVSQSVFAGSDVGVRTMTGGNFFTDIRVSTPGNAGWMTVGFDDYGWGNLWKGCEADTVANYGLHAHGYNTMVDGCRFFNNSVYGLDNVAVGVRFDQNSPYATVVNSTFTAQDESHRLARDIEVGNSSGVSRFGNQYANVTQHF